MEKLRTKTSKTQDHTSLEVRVRKKKVSNAGYTLYAN